MNPALRREKRVFISRCAFSSFFSSWVSGWEKKAVNESIKDENESSTRMLHA